MSPRARIAALAIAATLGISALAIGSSTRETALVAAALGVACAAITGRSRRGLAPAPALLGLLALAAGVTALQLAPLPLALIDAIGTKGQLVIANAAALKEAPPALVAASHDPATTWLELAKLAGYLGLATCCMRVAASERGRRLIAAAIAATGAAVAAVALAHELVGASALYGVYEPRFASAPVILAPFLSPNHLAALMALTAPVAAALALAGRGRARVAWAAIAALTAGVGLMALSRAGVIAIIAGFVALAAIAAPMRRRRERQRALRSNQIAIAVIAATAALAAALTLGRGAVDEIARTEGDEITGEVGKVAVWARAVDTARANPWLGVGRGAFEYAAPSSAGDVTFTHVENEYLQAVLDWGVPAALVMLALLIAAGQRAASRARSSLVEAGLAAGLIAVGLHQIADFALELPGVAYPTLAAFAVLARGELAPISRRRRGARAVALLAGAAVIAVAASPLATPARAETDALAEHFRQTPREALETALATWRRHPGDVTAATQAAEALFARRDVRAVAVANRALALAPAHPGLHGLVARMLRVSQRPEQALVHHRRAVARARDRVAAIRELIAAFPDRRVAAGGLPLDRRLATETLPAIVALADHDLGFHYTSILIERYPRDARFHRARAHHALASGRHDEAVESGRVAVDGNQPAAALIVARALLARGGAGDARDAEDVLTAQQHRGARPRAQIIGELRVLAAAQRAQSRHDAAIASLESAIELSGVERRESAPLYRELAESQAALGLDNAAAASRAHAAGLERRARDETPAPP